MPTTNYGWISPTDGASDDVWGALLITEMQAIDTTMFKGRQHVTATDAGSTTTATTFANLNAGFIPITPRSAASTLLITATFEGSTAFLTSTNTTATFQLYDSTNAVLIGSPISLGITTAGGGNGVLSPCSISASVANTVTTLRNFSLYGKTNNVLSAAGAAKMTWSIREIA